MAAFDQNLENAAKDTKSGNFAAAEKSLEAAASYAEGRRDLFTDLDIIVIMDSDMDFIQRTANLYQVLNVGVDLDLLVYTPDEFDIMRTRGFVRHALESGEVIYAKPSSG